MTRKQKQIAAGIVLGSISALSSGFLYPISVSVFSVCICLCFFSYLYVIYKVFIEKTDGNEQSNDGLENDNDNLADLINNHCKISVIINVSYYSSHKNEYKEKKIAISVVPENTIDDVKDEIIKVLKTGELKYYYETNDNKELLLKQTSNIKREDIQLIYEKPHAMYRSDKEEKDCKNIREVLFNQHASLSSHMEAKFFWKDQPIFSNSKKIGDIIYVVDTRMYNENQNLKPMLIPYINNVVKAKELIGNTVGHSSDNCNIKINFNGKRLERSYFSDYDTNSGYAVKNKDTISVV